MRGRAYGVLSASILAALLLLAQAAPEGGLALGSAAAVLLLGSVRPPPARLRRSTREQFRALLPVLSVVLAASAGFVSFLRLSLIPEPPPGLAWFARLLLLGSAALLFRTPPAGLVLHGLALVLALWTTAALGKGASPPPVQAALALAVVTLAAYGLLLAHSEESQRRARSLITVGVAPSPWGSRSPWLPALGVALLSACPLWLGISLPRPRGSLLGPSSAEPLPAAERAPSRPPLRVVGFTTALRMDQGHEALVRDDAKVAVVRLDPPREVLLLRGCALARATPTGFFPAERPLREPSLAGSTRRLRLEVTLLADHGGRLFAMGRPGPFEGLPVRHDPGGPVLARRTPPPHRYAVACEELDTSLDPDLVRGLAEPALLELPSELRADDELRELAETVAWGRSVHDRALRAVRWMDRNVRYDDRHPVQPGDLRTRVRAFLLRERAGICVEFATALAVILRLVDVPARVVTGYRTHERDDEGRFVVRRRHAHAWVEVALAGAGWVPYDPAPPPWSLPAEGLPDPEPEAPAAGEVASAARPGGTWAGGALALGVLAVLGVGWRQRRLRRAARRVALSRDRVPRPVLLGARERLFVLLEARGFQLDGAETPLEFLERLAGMGPPDPLLTAAVAHYTRLRFSGRPEPAAERELVRCLRGLR